MAKPSEIELTYLQFGEDAAPTTPGSGVVRLYAKTDGLLYSKDDAGTETVVSGGSGSSTFVGCKVYHNTTQTIGNGSDTVVNFNTEEFDSDAFHDTVTNNSRITIPTGKDGKYAFGAVISWAGSATGARFARFLKGGNAVRGGHAGDAGISTGGPVQNIYAVLDLAAGDYIQVNVYQTSGGDLTVGDASNAYGQSTFWCVKVG